MGERQGRRWEGGVSVEQCAGGGCWGEPRGRVPALQCPSPAPGPHGCGHTRGTWIRWRARKSHTKFLVHTSS